MQESRAEVIFILSIISLFIVIMVTFVIMILFFMKKKQKGFTSDLNAVRENYEKELYKAQLEIQEQTFSEISREIHDNVGQLLAMAKLGLNNLDFRAEEQAMKGASEISGILDKALEDLRHMSRMMNADFIRKRGLQKSIEMQVEFLQRTGIFKTHLDVQGTPGQISATKEIILFRILQEAINNIIRHAQATKIDVSLMYHSDFLSLIIADNGKGFQKEEERSAGFLSNGISNMKYRAELIGGDFGLTSEPGSGTKIQVKLYY